MLINLTVRSWLDGCPRQEQAVSAPRTAMMLRAELKRFSTADSDSLMFFLLFKQIKLTIFIHHIPTNCSV